MYLGIGFKDVSKKESPYIILLMEIGMKKYLKILLFSLMAFMGCEELRGPVGPAGADGTANMHVEVIQMTSNNT